MNKSVVFSGHRDVDADHAACIEMSVRGLVGHARHLFVGGARGADTLALLFACDLVMFDRVPAASLPEIWVVVPAAITNQPQVAQFAIERAADVLSGRFHLVEMGLPYNANSLKARNREMIDRAIAMGSPELLVYFKNVYKSGTYSAMCYARKKQVPIVHIPLDSSMSLGLVSG